MFIRYIRISVLLFLFFLSLFFLVFSSKFAASTSGKEPSTPIPDYHSYRPNPADPAYAELEDLSLLCGNDMIISKKFEVGPDEGSCSQSGDTLTCSYLFEEKVRVAVDTSYTADTRLPIMGNTQLVYNKENSILNNEELENTEKVNNLVSWYLNGAVNYAENPHPISDFGSLVNEWWTGYYANVINFSGPLRKLLPQDVQYLNKIEQIQNATGSNKGTENERYDQIVGCTYGVPTPALILEGAINAILSIFNLKIDIPFSSLGNFIGPCNMGGIFDLFKTEYKLSDWPRTVNLLGQNKLPPIMYDEKYPNPRDWWIAYERWRGNTCITVPSWKIIPKFLRNFGFCVENILKPNYYADLFMNIPMSSTEDRVGKLTINEPVPSNTDNVKVEVSEFELEKYATLYFPHMQESLGLAEELQATFKPQDGTDNSLGYTEPVDISSNCQILQVRTNEEKDDFLWGDEALAKFKYKAEFECTFKIKYEQVCVGQYCYYVEKYVPDPCEKKIYFNSKIDTYTPLANQVWAKLVAGNSAIARRMFPKVSTDLFGSFIDMPTVTTAQYKVKMGDVSVAPTTAELYFPHIGGVSEYFLKGIQTLLRPKGYGEDITFGDPLDYEPGDCSFDMSKINSAIQSAASKYNVPASMLKAVFEVEALPYIANPSSYKCEENSVGAAGVMGITKSAYNIVTCDNERIANDIPICGKTDGKFSRCNIDDTFELAARILLWKAGKWQYGPGRCSATGGISASNKMEVYNAAWKYYGSYLPDVLTKQYSYNLPGAKRPDPPGMNYADIICNKMGLCPPYPVQ